MIASQQVRRTFQALCILLAMLAPTSKVQAQNNKAWAVAETVKLDGCQVTVSKPVLVGRSSGYLWFPSLIRHEGDRLLAVMSNYPDEHVKESTAAIAWSNDGGLNWSQAPSALYGDINLRLASGDRLIMPYYLFP